MNLIDRLKNWLRTLTRSRTIKHSPVPEIALSDSVVSLLNQPSDSSKPLPVTIPIQTIDLSAEEKNVKSKHLVHQVLIPESELTFGRVDLNEHKPFLPNWGELDPTVSTISNGRELKDRTNYLFDEFVSRYGHLTTDLGYGLIYSIIAKAIERDKRNVSSALREAIVRSNDPLLCVAVMKDYCHRNTIRFNKYERITNDIIERREKFYQKNTKSSTAGIDFGDASVVTHEEHAELNKTNWLFNGTLIEIYPEPKTKKLPFHLRLKIPSLNDVKTISEFTKTRRWVIGNNYVVQWDGGDEFRILDFKKP